MSLKVSESSDAGSRPAPMQRSRRVRGDVGSMRQAREEPNKPYDAFPRHPCRVFQGGDGHNVRHPESVELRLTGSTRSTLEGENTVISRHTFESTKGGEAFCEGHGEGVVHFAPRLPSSSSDSSTRATLQCTPTLSITVRLRKDKLARLYLQSTSYNHYKQTPQMPKELKPVRI